MHALIAEDVLLRYPDHNKPFHIYTDASNLQLGAVIMQDGTPVAFYSCKLSPAQRNYTTMEKELLSIVKTLKNFALCYLGPSSTSTLITATLPLFASHHSGCYAGIFSWKNLHPPLNYIKGSDNQFADALSRLPLLASSLVEKTAPSAHSKTDSCSIMMDDSALLECFLNHPDPEDIIFPLDYELLQHKQFDDVTQQAAREANPTKFPILEFGAIPLICHLPNPEAAWKIAKPTLCAGITVFSIIQEWHG